MTVRPTLDLSEILSKDYPVALDLIDSLTPLV